MAATITNRSSTKSGGNIMEEEATTNLLKNRHITATINSGKKLCSWNDLPDWQKDNEYIISGYVLETNSLTQSIKSLFYLHNESVNIYTHLLPGICFLLVILFFNTHVIKIYDSTTGIDYFMINLFFAGCFTCLMMSSTFHCLKSHSEKVSIFGNKLDYLGIVVLIMTSMISLMYYGFYDARFLFYIFSGICTVLGLSCGYVSLSEKFRSREWRVFRAGMFVVFGLSALLPIICGTIYYGIRQTWIRIQVKWVLLGGVFYIIGAFIYGIRFPEKNLPGSFDIWGHSHQIFHVLVVCGTLAHLKALLGAYENAHEM
ncbi:PAQR-type receptor SCDLUD_000936 [Saccharomycodes ludwigii]|uniref:PAQR-type receptor n=1 Tax=Saccharomycodes ludwigii TaxID=36035 RepID=UPI001E89514C|nr:hypothetical protein SCDLUD_000936 [Saccharomycodes ludwigii]KAH3903311.1 hypothetical protein SCDLUD_000936 [Saccharomycodes ludwigii]